MTAGQDQPNELPDLNGRESRNGKGRFQRGITTIQRDVEAAKLKEQGYTYKQIAAAFGVSTPSAYDMVQRAMKETAEPAESVRQMEVSRLDASLVRLEGIRQTVLRLLERKHYTVSNGRLVYLADSEEPLEDDGFVLQAADRLAMVEDRLLKVAERRARLLGLDIPVKQEIAVDVGVEYKIVGVDPGQLR